MAGARLAATSERSLASAAADGWQVEAVEAAAKEDAGEAAAARAAAGARLAATSERSLALAAVAVAHSPVAGALVAEVNDPSSFRCNSATVLRKDSNSAEFMVLSQDGVSVRVESDSVLTFGDGVSRK